MKAILKSLYQNSRNEYIKELIFNTFHKNENIRASVASNSNTPVSVLEYLSKDKISSYVRYWVAKNPRTPIYILEKLSNDEYENVRENADNNLNEKIKSNIK